MKIGIPKETHHGEFRVAGTPDFVKKMTKKGFKVIVETGAGVNAGFSDNDFVESGAEIADKKNTFNCDIVIKITRPSNEEIALFKKDSILICMMEPYLNDGLIDKLADAGINVFAMELIPRTSRAQSMDVLSSQANIAGYRAVLEAAVNYPRFFPVMMTSAGMAKAAKLIVLGAGVAGLQAIATARRLGANVEAFDIRPEVKEQILSLGAKFIEIDVGESGSGEGGYAKELSDEGKKQQQELLMEKISKADIVITTALVPGKKAPVLVTEDAVKKMRTGSVIVDMAAAQGGNCPLSEEGKIIKKHGVTIVGIANYPSLVGADSSLFYGNNIINLLALFITSDKEGNININFNFEDDIIAASMVTHNGSVRIK